MGETKTVREDTTCTVSLYSEYGNFLVLAWPTAVGIVGLSSSVDFWMLPSSALYCGAVGGEMEMNANEPGERKGRGNRGPRK